MRYSVIVPLFAIASGVLFSKRARVDFPVYVIQVLLSSAFGGLLCFITNKIKKS